MDFFSRRRLGISLVLLFGLSAIAMAVDAFPPLVNWAAPATYTPSRSEGARALGDITFPIPFIGAAPCRQFDIRPGVLADNTPLAITLTGGACGIPALARAVSVNITVFSISGAGGNGVFKVDTVSPPSPAWINYPPTETQRGNAGVVPVNGSGQIIVEVNQGGGSIQLTVDVNGYYATFVNPSEDFDVVSTDAGFGVVYGENDGNGGYATSGVRGRLGGGVTGTNAAGVLGEAEATTGFVHGVFGRTSADVTDNSGVYGRDSTAVVSTQGHNVIGVSGVHGEGENGVIGSSSTNVSEFGGVTGIMLNTAGSLGAFASLGESFTTAIEGFGNLSVTGTKSFAEPDPNDPSKMIDYVALEGPEAGTYFRGTGQVSDGTYVINVPEDFRLVTDSQGLTVQLTPVGGPASMYVISEDLYNIVVHSDQDVKFHYMVNGVRAAFKDHQPIVANTVYNPRSPTQQMSGALAPLQRQRLIANGTYNADGSVNLETARAMGWAQAWEERARQVETLSPSPGQDQGQGHH